MIGQSFEHFARAEFQPVKQNRRLVHEHDVEVALLKTDVIKWRRFLGVSENLDTKGVLLRRGQRAVSTPAP